MPSSVPASVFERSVFARTRKACLTLPGTHETVSWGHPNFRAGRRTFCAFEVIEGRPSIAFKLPAGDLALRRRRDTYATPYGRGLWTSVWVDGAIEPDTLATLAERSYRAVATQRMMRALDQRRVSRGECD